MISYKQIADRGLALARRAARDGARLTRSTAGAGIGLIRRATGGGGTPKPDMDDITLARKVESEVFRGAAARKGKVNVNAVDGIVELRGEVSNPEQIRELEQRVLAIPEVRGVENLLHLPKTPARRQQVRAAGGGKPRREPRRVNAAKERVEEAEPRPDELAREREGRKPSPLGNTKQD